MILSKRGRNCVFLRYCQSSEISPRACPAVLDMRMIRKRRRLMAWTRNSRVELRRALAGQGHRFHTELDTEVMVHLYEQRGERFVDHLNEQFAIALWDTRRQRIVTPHRRLLPGAKGDDPWKSRA